jgi:hypothetical protein
MKKTITKSVHTKAFETATIKMEAPAFYTICAVGQSYTVERNGAPCDKQGKEAETINEVFFYRNAQIAQEVADYFNKCKK